MHVIISCHLDTIFNSPMADVKNGVHTGACDNLSGVLACAQLINVDGIHIEFTNGEETNMEGAKWVANRYSPDDTFIIVVDVTEKAPRWKISFTIENISKVDVKHIRSALKPLFGKYKIKEVGAESEAWLYRDEGFSCLEVDVVVTGGLHNLHNRAQVNDILVSSQAIRLLFDYFKDKKREEIFEGAITNKERK